MADSEREIRRAVDTGKVELGSKKTLTQILNKKPKLVVVSKNCPKEIKADIEYYTTLHAIPIFKYKGTSLKLGEVCGKPFPIASLSVLDPGDSKVLELIKGAK